MPLPSSGTISMNDIRVELGVPSQSPFSLDTARAGGYVALNTNSPTLPPSSGQISLSDWYSYCQSCDTYSFSYAATSAAACENNDPITIISDTIPIGVGSVLYLDDYSQAFYPYYYSDGTNWYFADDTDGQTIVESTGACSGGTATLAWSYSETGGADGVMDLYVNGSIVETRNNTSNGNYTVNQGDTIAMDLNMNQCTGGDNYSNVYTSGIISDADCTHNGSAALFTSNYTVQAIDIGTTIYFNGFASCEGACL